MEMKGEKIMAFLDTDKPRISENWRFRNDGGNMVVYLHSLKSHTSRVLSPFEALFILLFDGANSWAEIKAATREMINDTNGESDVQITQLTDDLATLHDLFTLEGPSSISFAKPLEDLIPDMINYSMSPHRLLRPIMITIAYSNRCQCDCIYCYAEREPSQEHSLEEWTRIYDELAENEITLVDIGGADIFCRKDALEIMEELAARNFSFFVSTKSHVTAEQARRLAALNIGNKDVPHWALRPMQISLDSTESEKAAFLTRQKNYLYHAEDSVKNLLEAGVRPRLKAVLTSYNADAPLNIVRRFAPMGVDEFHFVQYSRGLYRHNDILYLSLEQKKRLIDMERQIKDEFPDVFFSMQKDQTTGGSRNLPANVWARRPICSGGRTKMLVKPNGDVTLCEQTPSKAPFIVGNVFEQGVMGVWNSEAIRQFNHPPRESFKNTVCMTCADFDDCHYRKGWCFRDALACYGTIYEAPPDCPLQNKMPPRAI
jgi:radical SAM protein with 4Fe4S-binding SPASM domain